MTDDVSPVSLRHPQGDCIGIIHLSVRVAGMLTQRSVDDQA